MNGKPLSNTERLAATLLYFYRAGQESARLLDNGDGDPVPRPPSLDDLAKVHRAASVGIWEVAMAIAGGEVATVMESEPRGVRETVLDAAALLRKGQNFVEQIAGKRASINDLPGRAKR